MLTRIALALAISLLGPGPTLAGPHTRVFASSADGTVWITVVEGSSSRTYVGSRGRIHAICDGAHVIIRLDVQGIACRVVRTEDPDARVLARDRALLMSLAHRSEIFAAGERLIATILSALSDDHQPGVHFSPLDLPAGSPRRREIRLDVD